MDNKEELKYWQSKFRILEDWDIQLVDYDEYTGQCGHNAKTKKAEIFPWGGDDQAEDYIFHELLHICMAHIKERKPYKKKREAEELFVQDLCQIIFGE